MSIRQAKAPAQQLALFDAPPVLDRAGTESNLPLLFAKVFRRLGLRRALPAIGVEYCAFAGLRSSIHLNHDCLKVRVSDLLADAPSIVLEALAEILLAKVYRKRPSPEARECYLAYTYSAAMRERIDRSRRERGSKRQRPARGRYFDLEEIFARLNARFFQNALVQPRLGWSEKRSRTILGHYDAAHNSITISRWLDSETAPGYLVDYLVFHEMLHVQFPVDRNGDRRVVHSREFRQAEKQFPEYERVRRKLRNICG